MIPLSLIAADDAMLAITTFLANPSPLFTPATQQALRLAQEAAYAALPEVHPPSLAEYLAPDVPVGVHLGNPSGFRPNFGEWLSFWNEDGSPEPQQSRSKFPLSNLPQQPSWRPSASAQQSTSPWPFLDFRSVLSSTAPFFAAGCRSQRTICAAIT